MAKATMLDFVRKRLRESQLSEVAAATGIPLRTLYHLMHGDYDPRYSVVQQLYDWFREQGGKG